MSLLTNTSPAFEFGPIYVREQGQLRLLNGASSLKVNSGRSKSVRLFQKGFTVNLCIEDGDKPNTCRTDHIVFTYTKEGNLRYSPKSLFDVVLAFIADNIQHVDSLIGFPEQIAEKLFIAVEARKKFVDSSTSAKALFIFNEAYGSLVLQSLCLRERFMLVSEKLKEIQSFRGLRRLDLSSCKLGDDHELLRHLTSEPLMSLALLYLGDNGLSDCGLQKMTAPVRVMRKGLGNLEVLDLSGNPRISGRGMPYVCCFSKLRALNISGTGVTPNCSSIQMIQSKLSLFPAGEPLEEFKHSCCRTEGWAEQVVYQWERLCDRQRRKVGCRTVAQRFYGTNKFISLGTDGFSNTVQIKDPVKMQFLRKPNQDLSVQSPTSSTIGPCKRGTDRADEIDCSSPPVKCKRTELTLDDWDMLNCY
ncbi:leucine-rich repeat-containing protein 42 isoform X1 [Pristis pectinata]|uniref:leucine-rich repeat-containing protein 42 isoform X1 n=1 Tax=Pristis pectinata TaxID=685728 RepID=UPI00223E7F4B|nr:leucine-rich repeat-containing protein 42 isoform X1 [Pristis pectinata]XP_051867465.1 leucine-rich repeat-containing protein 42 isoform X1 [Pristis pectinata]